MSSNIPGQRLAKAEHSRRVASRRSQSSQYELLPLKVVAILPKQVHTADAACYVLAADNCVYLAKCDKDQTGGIASEWMVYALSQAVDINVPEARILEMPDGQLVFGSRIIQSVNDEVKTVNLVHDTKAAGMATALARILALDLFVANVDRNLGNYVSQTDSAGHQLFAIDHVRSFFWHDDYDMNMPSGCATLQIGRALSKLHGVDKDAALQVLDSIAALPSDWPIAVFKTIPTEWLDEDARERFCEWWSGGGRMSRIAMLRRGISDGSLP